MVFCVGEKVKVSGLWVRRMEAKFKFCTIGPFSTTVIACSGAMGNVQKFNNIIQIRK